jgi:hypothetical protein
MTRPSVRDEQRAERHRDDCAETESENLAA